jgi:hypothetical protein
VGNDVEYDDHSAACAKPGRSRIARQFERLNRFEQLERQFGLNER